jgi:uncharacterized cofD-like protein
MAFASLDSDNARVVVLGGGNGTSRLLAALTPLLKTGQISSLHALIHMADDGGSTGILRKQYEVGAMGDLTRCLLALSALRGDIRGEKFLAALEYRFANGDFEGHTLRNVLLTALELTSDLDAAIATMARVLQVPKYAGVIPTTLKPLTQQVEVRQGATWEVIGTGEHAIAHNLDIQTAAPDMHDVKVTFVEKGAQLNPRAGEALTQATHILVAPGHTYGTILPMLASLHMGGLPDDISAKIIVIMTLLTTPQQTSGFSGEDFVKLYELYLPKKADVVVANSGEAEDVKLVEGQTWVKFTEDTHPYELLQQSLVSAQKQVQLKHDVVPRAIAIHDPEKLRAVLTSLLT